MLARSGSRRRYDSSKPPHHVPEPGLSELALCIYLARRAPLSLLRRVVRATFVPAHYPATMERLYFRPRGASEDGSRRRRGCDVAIPWRQGHGGAAAATRLFRGDGVAAAPRPRRGYSAETPPRLRRGDSFQTRRAPQVRLVAGRVHPGVLLRRCRVEKSAQGPGLRRFGRAAVVRRPRGVRRLPPGIAGVGRGRRARPRVDRPHVLGAARSSAVFETRRGAGAVTNVAIPSMHRGDAARWLFRGDVSRRRRGRDAALPWRRIAAPPRPRRGYAVETCIAAQVRPRVVGPRGRLAKKRAFTGSAGPPVLGPVKTRAGRRDALSSAAPARAEDASVGPTR